MTIQEWFKSGVQYDSNGGQIWAINDAEYLHHVADVRGWGELQNLFKLDMDKAAEFQDKVGKFIAEAINDKLERERQSEQFYCDGQENNKNRCETQCLGCAEMQEIYEQADVVGQSEQLVCDHQWKSRFSEKRGYWRLCAKCSKEG